MLAFKVSKLFYLKFSSFGETVYIRARAFDNMSTGDYNFYVSKYQ